MPGETTTPEEFHIGLTMAGAVSAGCYTGGVMDYMFEILDLWEKARTGDLPPGWDPRLLEYIPDHKVIIDVMGGASAGGMTTVMAALYAMHGKINPVKDTSDKYEKKSNIFYDSWVRMQETAKGNGVLPRTLKTDDLENKIQSLLNSEFVDSICDEVFEDNKEKSTELPYVSERLEVLLSHTMLRHVPLSIDFSTRAGARPDTYAPEHSTFEHFTMSRYRRDYTKEQHEGYYLSLRTDGPHVSTLKLATMATGAFPIGLKFREFFKDELSSLYIRNTTQSIAFNRQPGIADPQLPTINWPTNFPDPFPFIGIDGGAINNEPFGEVLEVLKSRYPKKNPGDPHKYALIMIDPFPDKSPAEPYEHPEDLFEVVPAIIGTLWEQAKVKRGELLDAYSEEYYRGEIFPMKWNKKDDPVTYPIASASAMAFGGFLSIDFRQHDFFLGRDNARNFFRVFFTMHYDPNKGIIHPIHKSWTPDMINMYKIHLDGKDYLPIIPDLNYARAKLRGEKPDPFDYAVRAMPQYDPQGLFNLKDEISARVRKMLDLAYEKVTKPADKGKNPATAAWMNQYYSVKWWKRWFVKLGAWIGSGALRVAFNIYKKKIAKRAAKEAIEWILRDLEKRKLLKKTN